jgi:hypothetical protein
MLATFGGGSSRGFNPGGGGGPLSGNVDLKLMNNFQSSGGAYAFAAANTVSANFAASTSNGERLTSADEFTQTSPGIYKFQLAAGTYDYEIQSGEGSGAAHSQGIFFEGNLVINSDSYLLAAPGHHGTGSYSGGGATAVMVLASENTTHANIATNEVALVAGGGGGGYSNSNGFANWQVPTDPTTSHNQNRLGQSINSNQSYDGGASIFNNYTPYVHNGQNQYYPEHFVQGFEGGTNPDCSSSERGAFGGGGGSCPAGGGGYPGGLPGSNSPAFHGGGGGRSFYSGSTNNLSNFSTTLNNSNISNPTNNNTNYSNQINNVMGYFRIVGPN